MKIILVLGFLSVLACGKKEKVQLESKSYSGLKGSYLSLVNEHRSKLGLKKLLNSSAVQIIAHEHSEDMSAGTVPFGHEGFSDRCSKLRAELGSNACGEIVAFGQKDEAAVLKAWLNSPPHKKSIENPIYTHTGMSFEIDPKGRIYWTQIFLRIN